MCDTVDSQCFQYLGHITLLKSWKMLIYSSIWSLTERRLFKHHSRSRKKTNLYSCRIKLFLIFFKVYQDNRQWINKDMRKTVGRNCFAICKWEKCVPFEVTNSIKISLSPCNLWIGRSLFQAATYNTKVESILSTVQSSAHNNLCTGFLPYATFRTWIKFA